MAELNPSTRCQRLCSSPPCCLCWWTSSASDCSAHPSPPCPAPSTYSWGQAQRMAFRTKGTQARNTESCSHCSSYIKSTQSSESLLSHFLYNSNTEVLLRDMQHSSSSQSYKYVIYGENGNSVSHTNWELFEERGKISHRIESRGKITTVYHTSK